MPHEVNVAVMTYASEMYGWYAGTVVSDVYFCPERHGTYFGGFYMKDMPAMGKRDYDISLSRTGDGGSDFLDTLTAEQRADSHTVIVGCGESGILAAIRLQQAGVPFTIIEKNAGPGGTW